MLTIHSLLPQSEAAGRCAQLRSSVASRPVRCHYSSHPLVPEKFKFSFSFLALHPIPNSNSTHINNYIRSAHAWGSTSFDPRRAAPTVPNTYQFAEKIKNLKKHLYDPVLPPSYIFIARCAFFYSLSLSWWENEKPVHQRKISLVPAQTVIAIQWSLLKSIWLFWQNSIIFILTFSESLNRKYSTYKKR